MVHSQATVTIATFARKCGVGVETVRYYQRRGLLNTPAPAGRGAHGGGVRRYGEAEFRQLRFIRKAQVAGFTLQQIAELIALDSTAGRARARAMARNRIVSLDAEISELQQARDALSRLSNECTASKGPCPILAAFDRP